MALKFDEICIDAHDATALGGWWSKMLGWPQDVDDDGDVVLHTPPGAGPNWLFLAVPDDKVVKNRIHFDFRPDDQQAEVERVIGLGARHVDIGQGERELGRVGRSGGKRILHPRRRRLTTFPRACVSARRHAAFRGILRTLAAVLVLMLAGCGSSEPAPTAAPAADVAPLKIGPAAVDTLGGWLPDGQTAHAVRRVSSHRRMAGSRTAQGDSGRCPQGRGRRHRHRDHVRLAIQRVSAAAVRQGSRRLRQPRYREAVRRVTRCVETRRGQSSGHRTRRSRPVADSQRVEVRPVPDLCERDMAF